MLAPSAVNSRPWEFMVVQNRQKLNAIAESHPYAKMMQQASVAIIMMANPRALDGTKIEGLEMWQHDCGAATQNILLQAAHLNLGTCWCGIHPSQEKMDCFYKLFDIPSNRIPFCVIAVGVPTENFGSRGFYDESKVKWL